MRIHIAGCPAYDVCFEAASAEQYRWTLVTQAYPAAILDWARVWEVVPGSVVIMDSGAFTASTLGKEFTVEGYLEFAQRFLADHGSTVAHTHFITLDVVRDQRRTWRNFDLLLANGLDVMPVVTFGANTADVDRAAEHGYFALGGISGGISIARRRAYLDGVFHRLLARRKPGQELARVHALGVTSAPELRRYPFYSSDSSSWLRPLRYGHSKQLGYRRRLPSHTEGPAAVAAIRGALSAELAVHRKLELDVTAMWARRGITWDS